ncbi:putative porin [Herbaspirillum sp. Sphag1AN]|uniref:porin n=1 Tax=unclassified Herbaspirillum TaxID=2624150 RepID=UPI001791BC85|nr:MULTISPECIES: porin [unclassified Herbaspirillum]MBB3212350.1 putative porin [Herbaspirillum sp. Sphag1AN]MBB3245552.1 putative porin [Herbaspirillum sp. Sphag64]
MQKYQSTKLVKAMSVSMLFSGLLGLSVQEAHADSFLMQELANIPAYSPSTAANSVTIYGTVDNGINYIKGGSGAGKVQVQSGGEYTSQIGVYGREDLGGGLRAEFNVESGFQADTGALQTTTQLFNRESWVGLKSNDWGSIRIGNQIAPSLPLFIDVFGVVSTNSAFTWAGAAVVQTKTGAGYNTDLGKGATTLQTRVTDSIFYSSPRINGINVDLMVAANNSSTALHNTSEQGGVLTYAKGPWFLASSYNQFWDSTTGIRNDLIGVGGVYDVGSLVLSTAYNQYIPREAGDGIARVYTFGTILPRDRNIYRASLVFRDTSGVHNSSGATVSDSAVGIMLGYDYQLSKRTGIYTRAGLIKNYGASTIILNSQSLPTSSTGTPEAGATSSTISIGMYHHF